jgi:hypothetical protein
VNTTFFLLLFAFQGPGVGGSLVPPYYGQNVKIENISGNFQLEDFYFQEANKKHVGLVPINKIVIHFDVTVSPDARAALLVEMSASAQDIAKLKTEITELKNSKIPAAEKKASQDVQDFNATREWADLRSRARYLEGELAGVIEVTAVEVLDSERWLITLAVYPPYDRNPGVRALEFINKHGKDWENISFGPVFIVGGREATLSDTIKVKTVNAINEERLRKLLQAMKLGDFRVNTSAVVFPRLYFITVRKLEAPINLLTLANMLSEQPWIEYAQPVFDFLSRPFAIEFRILPNGLPTLGEKRTLVMEITIDDPQLRLRENEMPQLGQGNFTIVNADGDSGVFFRFEKGSKKVKEINGKKTWTFSWPFYAYRVGQHHFASIEIPCDGLEQYENARFLPPTFSVQSVIKPVQPPISDIQLMKNYRMDLGGKIDPMPQPLLVSSWLLLQMIVARVLLGLGLLIGFCALGGLMVARSKNLSQREKRGRLHKQLNLLECRIHSPVSPPLYAEIEKALRALLPVLHLAENISASELDKRPKDLQSLKGRAENAVCRALAELDRRHDREYQSGQKGKEIFVQCFLLLRKLTKGGSVDV